MAVSFPYPETDAAVPHVQALVGMVTGRVTPKLEVALHSGWVAQGYVQSLIAGMPAVVADGASISSVKALSDDEALAVLEKLADYDPSSPQAAGLLDGVLSGIGGRAALTLLLPVLQRWLTQWLEEGGLQKLIEQITTPKK